MPSPQLHDDGRTVTLDLHGATVDEAIDLTRRVVEEAARRGRSSVKVIHGSSTSHHLYRNRTIKHTLHRQLDEGQLSPFVTSDWRSEGYLMLSLDLTAETDPTPLRLIDVLR